MLIRFVLVVAVLIGLAATAGAQSNSRYGALQSSIEADAYWLAVVGQCKPADLAASIYALDNWNQETKGLPYAEGVYLNSWFNAGQTRGMTAYQADPRKACGSVTPEAQDRFDRLSRRRALFLDPKWKAE